MSLQYDLGTCIWNFKAQVTSNKWRILRSTTPFFVEYGGKKIDELYHGHQKIETKMYENIYEHYQIKKYEVKHKIESLFP